MATCETCRWFRFKGSNNGNHECRRFPPQTLEPMKPKWPYPNTDEWCGEWRATQAAEDAAMQAAIKEAFDD